MTKKAIAVMAAIGTSAALSATVFGMSQVAQVQNPADKYAGTYSVYGVGMNTDEEQTENSQTDGTQSDSAQTEADQTNDVKTIFSVEDMGVSGKLTLNRDGTGSFSCQLGDETDQTDDIEWSADQNGKLKLIVDGEEMDGTIKNGIIDYNLGSIDESLSAFDFYMAGENADTTGFEVVTLTDIINSIDLDGICDAAAQYLEEALQNSGITVSMDMQLNADQLQELVSSMS